MFSFLQTFFHTAALPRKNFHCCFYEYFFKNSVLSLESTGSFWQNKSAFLNFWHEKKVTSTFFQFCIFAGTNSISCRSQNVFFSCQLCFCGILKNWKKVDPPINSLEFQKNKTVEPMANFGKKKTLTRVTHQVVVAFKTFMPFFGWNHNCTMQQGTLFS